MFDSIRCSYPLPLPLEVVDDLPDIYEVEFQTKDLDNLLNEYYLNENGELFLKDVQYQWKDDDDAFLKGYMEIVEEKIVSTHFHGIINLYCYVTVNENNDTQVQKDVCVDYLAKFTNGKLENIEMISYEIKDATERITHLNKMMIQLEEKRKLWYNKYIFHTKFWKFFKWKVIIGLIKLMKKFTDTLYNLAVRYL